MFKKELGISVYPEKFSLKATQDYLELAAKYGFKKMFISFLQFTTPEAYHKHEGLYQQIIKFAKQLGFYVIADIADVVFVSSNTSSDDLSYFKTMQIDCLRLDSPLMAKQVADATHKTDIDIQINMSNNDHFIDNILDYQPVVENLSGSHNFYPLACSGLGWDFFMQANHRYTAKSIHTTAFIGSHYGTAGPQNYPIQQLVSVERHRNLPITTQAKELWASGTISDVIIGNQCASEQELNALSLLDRHKIEFDLSLVGQLSEIETDILLNSSHFSRGDVNQQFVRSTQSRVTFKNQGPLVEKNHQHAQFVRGDVLIINQLNPNYQKELIIVTSDVYQPNGFSANLVGKIKPYDLMLLMLLKPWAHFKFKVIE